MSLAERYSVAVVGGGQAGLAISCLLRERDVDHVVFEKHRIAQAWRASRWDTFCLVTPNWQCTLPNFEYAGGDPHGFMKKDEIVRYIEAFAASFGAPVLENVTVRKVFRNAAGMFEIETSAGRTTAEQIVVATGGYHTPVLPRMGERLAPDIVQLHSSEYKNPQSLPAGGVLVVGTGQSGCQIAEDLHLAGRRVHLAVGSAPRVARRYRGKDVVEWLDELGFYDLPVDEHPLGKDVRKNTNHYVTGRDGGHDIDLRAFALEGMQLYGRLQDVGAGSLAFADDLKTNLDRADFVSESIKTTIDAHISRKAIEAPLETRYRPVWEPSGVATEVDYRAAQIGSVIWCTGYRTDYRWLDVPIFNGSGYPTHERGVTPVSGLYFLGLPWLFTWGSGRFSGVARDARHVLESIEQRRALPALSHT